MAKKKLSRQTRICFSLEQAIPENTTMGVYAFDHKGNLLEQGKISNQEAVFDMKPEKLARSQVFFAPEHPGDQANKNLSIDTLKRRGAHQPALRLNADREINILPIPAPIITQWGWRRCRVQGQVSKRFNINGQSQVLPICNARVHICEVDPIYLIVDRLPDHILDRWRWDLIEVDPLPDPIRPSPPRLPELPFLPVINPIDPVDPVAPIEQSGMMSPHQVSFSRPAQAAAAPRQLNLSQDIRTALQSSNLDKVRSVIQNNILLFCRYYCWWPYLWPWLRCDEIRTVMTDENGRFETSIWYSIFGDKPDLYFWVEQQINGVWTTIYRPSKACSTYWNYKCGKEVNIRVTDHRAVPGCEGVLEGSLAWIQTVGHHAPVSGIEQNNSMLAIQGVSGFNTIGLTDWYTSQRLAGYGLSGKKVRPFRSARLSIWMYFGNETGPGRTVAQYRWSYRRTKTASLGNVNASDLTWRYLDNPISKPYYVEVPNGLGGVRVITKNYPMDPDKDGLFSIPPPYASAIEPGARWHTARTNSVVFDTDALLGDGLYELRLEVFDANGNQVAVPAGFYQLTSGPGESAPAASSYLSGNAFIFKMRIDNQSAEGDLLQPSVGGNAASTNCGFMAYADRKAKNVQLAFKASQPQDFAVFSKRVIRGAGNVIANATDAGMVIGSSTDYSLSGQVYRTFLSPEELLQTCPQAAFSSRLVVSNLHTDGSEDDLWIAYVETVAWALEPATP